MTRYDNLIPLNQLSESSRNVVNAWNKLPLAKFKGLLPGLLDKLKYLINRYGEDTLCRTVADIANSPFLLGRKPGHTWKLSLVWLLEPENFAKIRSGKYREDKNSCDSGVKRLPGEPLSFYLPGEGKAGLSPGEQEKVLHSLFVPTTPAQIKAARLIRLPGFEEVPA